MKLPPITVPECDARFAMHMNNARAYADRSMLLRDACDLRRSAWEQNAATEQYRIAREYRDCASLISGQARSA